MGYDRSAMKIFLAYPSKSSELVAQYKRAVEVVRKNNLKQTITLWTELSVSGRVISRVILEQIDRCDILCADITKLNMNVVYEIGYAIGRQKSIYHFFNPELDSDREIFGELGIFDVIGYDVYKNSDELAACLRKININADEFFLPTEINQKAPFYLLSQVRDEKLAATLFSYTKSVIGDFRSFDPYEQARLPVYDAIREVASSVGVIIAFVPNSNHQANIHNLRASFVAGISHGLNKETLLIQLGNSPAPLDYRDEAKHCVNENQVKKSVGNFYLSVRPFIQQVTSSHEVSGHTFLDKLEIGASVAENEANYIGDYYLINDAYLRAEKGEVRIVVGRKGAGKTALFVNLRNQKMRRRENVVVDLKPEGYKLLKFREDVLSILQQGTLEHLVTALWDYVLLLEIAYKLLEIDKAQYRNNHKILPHYEKLKGLYFSDDYYSEGDFSERLDTLLENLGTQLDTQYQGRESVRLNNAEVTKVLYQHHIAELRDCIIEYLHHKKEVWILVDNVDKGWPADGLTEGDVSIVRCLINGAEKLKRQLADSGKIFCAPIVFLRNDVYERLVRRSADKGKISVVSVDWSDRGLLKEMLRLRFTNSGVSDQLSFNQAWSRIAEVNISNQKSIEYILDRSFMRPRALLEFFIACKSVAVSKRHEIIFASDILEGYKKFSNEIVQNISAEIQDVAPNIQNALYIFIDEKPSMNIDELNNVMKKACIKKDQWSHLLDLFLWYGVIGLEVSHGEVRYIYDVNYDFLTLTSLAKKQNKLARFTINPAFRPALAVSDPAQGLQPRLL